MNQTAIGVSAHTFETPECLKGWVKHVLDNNSIYFVMPGFGRGINCTLHKSRIIWTWDTKFGYECAESSPERCIEAMKAEALDMIRDAQGRLAALGG